MLRVFCCILMVSYVFEGLIDYILHMKIKMDFVEMVLIFMWFAY